MQVTISLPSLISEDCLVTVWCILHASLIINAALCFQNLMFKFHVKRFRTAFDVITPVLKSKVDVLHQLLEKCFWQLVKVHLAASVLVAARLL